MKYTFVPLVILKNSPCPWTRLTFIYVHYWNGTSATKRGNNKPDNIRSSVLEYILYKVTYLFIYVIPGRI